MVEPVAGELPGAMIGVVLAGGNSDELIKVMIDRMRTPNDYLEVARAMEAADRRGEAIRWARRGLTSMGTRFWQVGPLRAFLGSLYVADGDDQAAEDLWWEDFGARPSVESYRRWLLRPGRATRPRPRRGRPVRCAPGVEGKTATTRASSGASVLVDVLLYEGKADEAWQMATRQGVGEQTWMKLAQARGSEHPLDAVPIYERAVGAKVDTKKAAGYQDAVRILKRLEKLAAAGGEADLFRDVIARPVGEHARKPSFMDLLRRAGWI